MRPAVTLVMLAVCSSWSSGCGEKVPDEWKDVVPIEGGRVLESDTDKEHITIFYDQKQSASAVRDKLRANLEKKGLKRGYECEFSDKRLADGYLKSPDAYEYTLIPKEGEDMMVTISHHGDVKSFDAPPDPTVCKMLP